MRIAATLATLAGLSLAAPANAFDLYAAFGTGASFAGSESGGFNFAGPHENTGDGNQTAVPIIGAIGIALSPQELGIGPVGLRLELSGSTNAVTRLITGSFEPPDPDFFYNTSVEAWTGMANLWVDLPLDERFGVYVGGGAGIVSLDLTTDDTVVAGKGHELNFAWSAGAGVTWRVASWAVLDFGYRYLDLGDASLGLDDGFDPVGDLSLDNIHAHQVLASVRIQLPSTWIWPR